MSDILGLYLMPLRHPAPGSGKPRGRRWHQVKSEVMGLKNPPCSAIKHPKGVSHGNLFIRWASQVGFGNTYLETSYWTSHRNYTRARFAARVRVRKRSSQCVNFGSAPKKSCAPRTLMSAQSRCRLGHSPKP